MGDPKHAVLSTGSRDSKGPTRSTVAVVGAVNEGPIGLAALKCLVEEGFDAVAFESRDVVGGVWNYSSQQGTNTSLKETMLNTSKYISSFSDFPFPEDYPLYPTASLMHRYLRSYAEQFDLYKRIHFNSQVTNLTYEHDHASWRLSIKRRHTASVESFDRVIVCNGLVNTPVVPELEGIDAFQGRILHSRDYKGSTDYQDKRVVVVGIGNTAADIAVDLAGKASGVYLAHRRGAVILSRLRLGPPIDLNQSWHIKRLIYFMEDNMPSFTAKFMDWYLDRQMKQTWEIDPSWNLIPAPSVSTTVPCVNEGLIPCLAAGSVASVRGLRRVCGPKSVELEDGTVIDDVDAVIMATGYSNDMTLTPWLMKTTATESGAPAVPRLFMQMFPPEHAERLAFLNSYNVTDCAWVVGELGAMAIAQLWAGKSRFPTEHEMNASIERHAAHRERLWKSDPSIELGAVRTGEFFHFLHDTAGTGLREALGWGRAGWKFWWQEREMARLMGWGFISPHMLRVVDAGKRKAWDGARDAIRKLNKEVQTLDKTTRRFFIQDVHLE